MLAVLIGGLSMVSPFSIDTFFPAFHAMEKALNVSAWQLQQVITAYMVPFAFASLVHGPLSDALGRRPVMIAGMAEGMNTRNQRVSGGMRNALTTS